MIIRYSMWFVFEWCHHSNDWLSHFFSLGYVWLSITQSKYLMLQDFQYLLYAIIRYLTLILTFFGTVHNGTIIIYVLLNVINDRYKKSPKLCLLVPWWLMYLGHQWMWPRRMIFLTHLPTDKLGAISQTTLSSAFSWMKSLVFWFESHLWVKLTIREY